MVRFARRGDLESMKEMGSAMPEAYHKPDPNGWTVLHEAVREGHVDIVQFLITEQNVDKDLITDTGVTPLNIARQFAGKDHAVTKYLEELGAVDVHPYRKTAPSSKPTAAQNLELKQALLDEL
jgi:ankyrin repeat protein